MVTSITLLIFLQTLSGFGLRLPRVTACARQIPDLNLAGSPKLSLPALSFKKVGESKANAQDQEEGASVSWISCGPKPFEQKPFQRG